MSYIIYIIIISVFSSSHADEARPGFPNPIQNLMAFAVFVEVAPD